MRQRDKPQLILMTCIEILYRTIECTIRLLDHDRKGFNREGDSMLKSSQYFRVSVNRDCNLDCYFCHKEGTKIGKKALLSPADIEFASIVARDAGFDKLKITGGEPLMRQDIVEIVELLERLGYPDFSLVTNGVLLEEKIEALQKAGMPRLNITLNSLDPERFASICRMDSSLLKKVVQGIDRAIDIGFGNIKINFVFSEMTDESDLKDLLEFVRERRLTLVVLPVIEQESQDQQITLEFLHARLKSIGVLSENITTDNEGIRRREIVMQDGANVLLRVDELNRYKPFTFCSSCDTTECREGIFPIRLSAEGHLLPCMSNIDHRYDIRQAIKDRNPEIIHEMLGEIRALTTSDNKRRCANGPKI